jgi:hypothetical protein
LSVLTQPPRCNVLTLRYGHISPAVTSNSSAVAAWLAVQVVMEAFRSKLVHYLQFKLVYIFQCPCGLWRSVACRCKVKVKLPATRHAGATEERSHSSFSLLISAPDGDEWSASCPGRLLSPGRDPGTHWIGGWVDLRAGLDTESREQSFTSDGDETPVVQSAIRHYTDWVSSAGTFSEASYLTATCWSATRQCHWCNLAWPRLQRN